MKILTGFEALDYILKNKDKRLYNRKGQQLYYCKKYGDGEIKLTGKYNNNLEINDKFMVVEWYTENKTKVLLKIYVNGCLCSAENHYVFNDGDNIDKLKEGILAKYKKQFEDMEVTIEHEMFLGEVI